MKKIFLLFSLLYSLTGFAQKADAITGKWLIIPKQNLIINVYRVGNSYLGKITWVKDKEKAKPGFLILEKLVYNEDLHSWDHGKIHNPSGGGTYNAIAKIRNDGTLEVHAYKGFKFLGTDKLFKRVK